MNLPVTLRTVARHFCGKGQIRHSKLENKTDIHVARFRSSGLYPEFLARWRLPF
jgi:hypothetical protein